jgi:hypothetical protein
MERSNVKEGLPVWYAGMAAVVLTVLRNGVQIKFEQSRSVARVSAADLTFRGEHVNS